MKGKGPIWLDGVRCKGFEKNMELCPHNPWAQVCPQNPKPETLDPELET
jgi:hypothetical protein